MWPKVLVLAIAFFSVAFGACLVKMQQLEKAINQHAMIIDLIVKDLEAKGPSK